jgi:hypothetical protein
MTLIGLTTPFPEWEQLNIIFGTTSKGDMARTFTQRTKACGVQDQANDNSAKSGDDNVEIVCLDLGTCSFFSRK